MGGDMSTFFRPVLSGFLLLALLGSPGFAYELPQVCHDANNLEKNANYFQLPQVVELYTQCLDENLSPTNRAIAYNNRGYLQARLGNLDQALEDCNKSIELNPKNATAYDSRGYTLIKSGKLDKAIADFSKAIDLDPTQAIAYAGRGHAYKLKDDRAKAEADMKKALELNPGIDNSRFD